MLTTRSAVRDSRLAKSTEHAHAHRRQQSPTQIRCWGCLGDCYAMYYHWTSNFEHLSCSWLTQDDCWLQHHDQCLLATPPVVATQNFPFWIQIQHHAHAHARACLTVDSVCGWTFDCWGGCFGGFEDDCLCSGEFSQSREHGLVAGIGSTHAVRIARVSCDYDGHINTQTDRTTHRDTHTRTHTHKWYLIHWSPHLPRCRKP